jgi:hypothetical protein
VSVRDEESFFFPGNQKEKKTEERIEMGKADRKLFAAGIKSQKKEVEPVR